MFLYNNDIFILFIFPHYMNSEHYNGWIELLIKIEMFSNALRRISRISDRGGVFGLNGGEGGSHECTFWGMHKMTLIES